MTFGIREGGRGGGGEGGDGRRGWEGGEEMGEGGGVRDLVVGKFKFFNLKKILEKNLTKIQEYFLILQ